MEAERAINALAKLEGMPSPRPDELSSLVEVAQNTVVAYGSGKSILEAVESVTPRRV
jgi:hypothetical protein